MLVNDSKQNDGRQIGAYLNRLNNPIFLQEKFTELMKTEPIKQIYSNWNIQIQIILLYYILILRDLINCVYNII